MNANNPTPYQRHTEADQHHEDPTRLPDLCRRGLHDLSDPDNVRHRSDGGRQCKPCQREAQRRWYENNRERRAETQRRYAERTREHRAQVRRARYQANPEPYKARAQQRYWADPERVLQQKREYRARKRSSAQRPAVVPWENTREERA